jgi:hypothetical protein
MSTVLERRVREHLTEPRPVPEPMSDTEILDFLSEHIIQRENGRVVLRFDGITAWANTLREAVCLADGQFKEMNK